MSIKVPTQCERHVRSEFSARNLRVAGVSIVKASCIMACFSFNLAARVSVSVPDDPSY